MKKYMWSLAVALSVTLTAVETVVGESPASDPSVAATSVAILEEGVPGGVWLDAAKITAEVTKIDAATRDVTLVDKAGKSRTVTAGPEVVNFDQIRVGDQVTVALVTELSIHLQKSGEETAGPETGVLLARAAEGEKPGAMLAGASEVRAVVEAIDVPKHEVTLRGPGGDALKVQPRKDVDLTQVSVGDEVVIRVAAALAIAVETP